MLKTNEFRKKMADVFIKSLEEKQFEWKKEWAAMETPYNVISGRKYRGTNKFFLYLQSQERLPEGEIPDPRWATFKQIQDAGWKVKKGAKGFVVELWKPYDFESKREISWKEYIENHLSHEKYGVITRNYYVFNGRDIEGIPELHVNNHKAYIQSWTKALSEKPEMLMKAIRDAEKAANYLEYHAEILSKEEYQETLTLHENEETPTPGNTSEKMVEKTANPITREADLKANGYKLTPALKKHMDRLDQLTGRKNSVKDIYKAYKTHDFHGDPETEKTIKSIGKIFQRQEMQIKAVIPER